MLHENTFLVVFGLSASKNSHLISVYYIFVIMLGFLAVSERK